MVLSSSASTAAGAGSIAERSDESSVLLAWLASGRETKGVRGASSIGGSAAVQFFFAPGELLPQSCGLPSVVGSAEPRRMAIISRRGHIGAFRIFGMNIFTNKIVVGRR